QKGLPQDICGNDDTLDQTGRAYFGDHLAPGAVAKTRAHPLWTHIQRLNAIRRAVPALQKAPMSLIREWGSGMSFVRDWNNGKSYAVVGLAAGSDQHITVVGIRNGLYRDAVTGNTVKVEGGSLVFDVKANSAGIYVLNGPGKIGSDGVFLR
ncbi:MAG TPA: alpha-amylase, partial [Candidatus Ozemobacteraceae bacterium]|nr:alpha-amylase [Candidatus Ozemobacteraceae bacterium]